MSIIRIKGRPDPIIIDYHIAKYVKQRKFGDPVADPPIMKAPPDALCDLGDVWAGEYRKISDIELNDRPKAIRLARPEDTEPFDKEFHRKEMDRIGENLKKLGLLKKVGDRPRVELTRSGLNEYREKHGVEYMVPEGVVIIEDIVSPEG